MLKTKDSNSNLIREWRFDLVNDGFHIGLKGRDGYLCYKSADNFLLIYLESAFSGDHRFMICLPQSRIVEWTVPRNTMIEAEEYHRFIREFKNWAASINDSVFDKSVVNKFCDDYLQVQTDYWENDGDEEQGNVK